MYDYLLSERFNSERHQELIRQAQEMRKVKNVLRQNRSAQQHSATPIRRAVHFIAALMR